MKVLIFGSKGMVGSSVVRNLKSSSKITLFESSRNDTDLFSFEATKKTIESFRPNIIINSAAKVGRFWQII